MPRLLFLFLILFVVVGIAAFIGKIYIKNKMSGTLGRSVKDHELTSLNSWMEVHEKQDEKSAQKTPQG